LCFIPHWLLALVISGLVGLVINFVTCIQLENRHVLRDEADRTQGFLADQGSGVFFGYSVWMMLVTMVLFLLVSLILKVFSKNSNRVPFPYSRR
jgi:quinol-cytochrome oxidoreductase complex cytochrome b subunit